jgi:hypothetical protein
MEKILTFNRLKRAAVTDQDIIAAIKSSLVLQMDPHQRRIKRNQPFNEKLINQSKQKNQQNQK